MMLSFINAVIFRAATAVCSHRKWDHWQSNCRYQVIASRRAGERERERNTVILNRHLVSRRTLQAWSLPFSFFRPPSLSPLSHSPSSSPRSFARTFIIPYVATRARWFPRGRYLHRRIFDVRCAHTYVFVVHTRPGRYCEAMPCGRHANPKKMIAHNSVSYGERRAASKPHAPNSWFLLVVIFSCSVCFCIVFFFEYAKRYL